MFSWSECYIGIHYRYLMPHSLCLMVQFHPKVAIVVTSHFRPSTFRTSSIFILSKFYQKPTKENGIMGISHFLSRTQERDDSPSRRCLLSLPHRTTTHPYGPIRVSRPSIQREQYSIFLRASSPKPRSLPRSFFA